jgi:hypothetical protein
VEGVERTPIEFSGVASESVQISDVSKSSAWLVGGVATVWIATMAVAVALALALGGGLAIAAAAVLTGALLVGAFGILSLSHYFAPADIKPRKTKSANVKIRTKHRTCRGKLWKESIDYERENEYYIPDIAPEHKSRENSS